MYRIVFLFSLLPSYAFSTSFGSIPIRYFSLFCLLFVASVKKELLLFVLLAVAVHPGGFLPELRGALTLGRQRLLRHERDARREGETAGKSADSEAATRMT